MVNLGPLTLPAALLVAVVSLFLALVLAGRYDRQHQTTLEKKLWWVVVAALVVGRAVFIGQHWSAYQSDPWAFINIKDGGFSLVAALFAAALCVLFLAYKHAAVRQGLIRSLGVAGLVAIAGGFWAASLPTPTHFDGAELAVTDLQGQPLEWDQLQNQPMVVNLWATWCPPCRAEMPVFARAQKHYPDINFVFINQGENSTQIQQFLTAEHLDLEHVWMDPQSQALAQAQTQAIPTTLFINAQGELVTTRRGEVSMGSLGAYLAQIQ